MERFPKIRFVVITILVITVVNIVALFFILRFSFHEHQRGKMVKDKEFAKRGFDFLKEKLELTPDQTKLFQSEKDTFFASANLIFDKLEMQRLEMIKEFNNKEPDTVALYQIADSMGLNHGTLKREVVKHLLKLRSYCSPAQITKLDSLYNFLIRTDSPWRNKFKAENQHSKEEAKERR